MIEQYINISNTSIDSQVENSNQSYTFSISSGSTLTLPDNRIESSGGNFQDVTPAVLPTYVISDIEWIDSDGMIYSTEYGQPIICTPPLENEVLVNNSLFATSSNGVPINVNVINTDNVNVGSKVGSNFVIGNSVVNINSVVVGNIKAEDTSNKFVTINGVQVGTWSNPDTWKINVLQSGTAVGSKVGVDWIIATAASGFVQNSNSSYTASVASGGTLSLPDINIHSRGNLFSVNIPSVQDYEIPDVSWTDTDGTPRLTEYSEAIVCSAGVVPTISIVSTNYIPVHNGPTYTVTAATATGLTPTSYTFIYPIDNAGNLAITTQAGNSLAITPRGLGSQIIRVIATDGVTAIEGRVTVTVSYTRVTSIYTDGVNDFARGFWKIGSAQGRALSISFWLKYVSGSAFFIRIGEPVDGQNYTFLVQPSSTGPALNFRIGAGTGYHIASAAITAGVWNHVVMTYRCPGYSTANPIAIYVNGTSVYSTTTITHHTQVVKPSIQLGLPDFGGAASVKLHGLSFYEDCLSAAQASTLRNGGTPLSIPSLSGVDMSEYFGGEEAAQVPSTNTSAPWTEVKGINGGRIYCNNSFASPYGLVTDIP